MFTDYKDVLSPSEVAKALGIGLNNTYSLINSGEISSIKIGRKIIVPKLYLIDFIKKNRNNS